MKRHKIFDEVKTFDEIPDGWRKENLATTAPLGWFWAFNGKGLFSGEFEHGLVKEKKDKI